jgi:hypothetical protein
MTEFDIERDDDATRLLALQRAVQEGIESLKGLEGIPYSPNLMRNIRECARKMAREGHVPNPDVLP